MLQGDDLKFKNQASTTRMCNLFDMFEIEDAHHFIMRSPHFLQERNAMLYEIDNLYEVSGSKFFDDNVDMLYRLLGKPHDSLNEAQSEKILFILLKTISSMYKENI